MTVKRYLFLSNAERLDWIISRYVAMDHPDNDAGMPAAELRSMQRHRENARDHDLLAPSEWCVLDADAAELAADNPDLYQPSPQAVAFLGRNLGRVDRFLHFCDLELAQAWLDIANRLVASDSAIDRLPRERQFEVCRDAWMSLGNVFRALNVRPYGWQKYRHQWEWALRSKRERPWTDAEIARGLQYVRHERGLRAAASHYIGPLDVMRGPWSRPLTYAEIGRWLQDDSSEWSPRSLQSAPWFFPNTAAAPDPGGAWRLSMKSAYLGQNPSSPAPKFVAIGTKADVNESSGNKVAGAYPRNGPGCFSDLRTTAQHCFTPTQDVLYVWLGNDGVIAGNRTPAAGIRTWRSMSWQYFTENVYPAPALYATVPMKWYIDMLRTILRELSGRDLLSVIHEIRLDVIGKNTWENDALRGVSTNNTQLDDTFIVTEQDRRMSDSRRTMALVGSAATAITSVVPIVGAIVGLSFAVAQVLGELFPSSDAVDNIPIARDIYGRITPTFEIFQMDSSARMGQDVSYIANVLPPPPPGYEPTPTTVRFFAPALTVLRQPVVEATRQGVVVLGIPPFSVVFVGDAEMGNVGSEVVGTQANPMWFTPTPTGNVTIRVLAVDQSIRTATVAVSAARIASVPYDAMTVARAPSTTTGRLTVTGQPGWALALALVGSTAPLVGADIDASGTSVSQWPVGQYTLGVNDKHGRFATQNITLPAEGLTIDAATLLRERTGWLTINGPVGWALAIGHVGATTPLLSSHMPQAGSVSLPWASGPWALGIDDGQGHAVVSTITIPPNGGRLTIDARTFITQSTQQRQTAEGGSTGMIVAGVVGLGALAIFVATVALDGKPAPKRNPRR